MSRGHLIAVASGKGGVGKTWLCISLAHALAKAGRRVLLFDADFGLANVDIQLGLMPKHDLCTVLAGKVGLRDAIVTHPEGFNILPGRSGSGMLTGLSSAAVGRVQALARTAAAEYDVPLADLGASLEPPVRRMAGEANELLIITTDEPTSLTDAYAVLKLHAKDSPTSSAATAVSPGPFALKPRF